MSMERDVVVVGGGIVGLATAHQLLQRRPDLRVTVLEREAAVGQHQSSRNSGVLHAGLYYPPGSAKARWSRAGKLAMERFCQENGVPAERRGKVVVAVRTEELPGLRALAERARTNGVEIHDLDAEGIKEHEPHVTGVAGIWTPETAVTDFGAVCRALAANIEQAGGEVRTGVTLTGLEERSDLVRIETDAGPLEARTTVVCAGLQSDRILAMSGIRASERIVPFRGSWLELRPGLSHLVRGNVYPVPAGGLPFLGVHLTRRIDGAVWIGPNAVLAPAREGQRPWSVSPRDLAEVARFGGIWRLARQHSSVAVGEVWRDRVLPALLREVQRYVPEITRRDVRRGPWGVRAQLVAPDGSLVDDFKIRTTGRILHVLNAPSPAATASLSIGDELSERVAERIAS
ncbi:MAG: L-2-hydroxyglutarate oxidase [Nitriliruptor sp.]|nr:MAG: L-2-hydroxyglutarate oxidase [Nitriliruptor sp.]